MAALLSALAPMMDAVITHETISATAERVAADLKAQNSEIRVVPPEEHKQAAASLAESFVEDHVMRYAIDTPDSNWSDKERWAVYVQMMEYITYATCIEGVVTTVGPNYDCVALWNPPDVDLDNMILMFRSGIWRLHYQLTSEGRERYFNEFQPLLASALDDVLGDRSRDCWYLNYIGTKPESRGHGYAKKLIQHITDRVSQRGLRACFAF